jgi:hypothetical protein
MNILNLLLSKPNNPHYLHRYYNFIINCKNKNVGVIQNIELHHICPKARDLFPEYADGKLFKWNIVKLTYRQHFLAHYMLWKAYGGSQVYAFVSMCNQTNKRDGITCKSSKIYNDAKTESYKMLSDANKGYASYTSVDGTTVRCKTTDPRVISGELTSTSKGRIRQPISAEHKKRLSESHIGREYKSLTIEQRISRRKNKTKIELFFDQNSKSFVEIDPVLTDSSYIKVFTSGKIIWDAEGNYRRCDARLPFPPPGWFFIDPTKIFRVIDLATNNYVECTHKNLPDHYGELTLCKHKKIRLHCTTLEKNIVMSHASFQKHGCPSNCTIL